MRWRARGVLFLPKEIEAVSESQEKIETNARASQVRERIRLALFFLRLQRLPSSFLSIFSRELCSYRVPLRPIESPVDFHGAACEDCPTGHRLVRLNFLGIQPPLPPLGTSSCAKSLRFFPSCGRGYLRLNRHRFIARRSGCGEQLANRACEMTIANPSATLGQSLVNHFERVALIHGGFDLGPAVPNHLRKPLRGLLAECDDSG